MQVVVVEVVMVVIVELMVVVMGCPGTLWVGTSHPLKTKIALVNVILKLQIFC